MNIKSKGHYIEGQWIEGSGEPFNSLSPASGKVIWEGRRATVQEIDKAVKSSSLVFNSWSKLDISKRIEYLKTYINILKENKERISNMLSEEIGKPLWESATEVGAMIGKIEPSLQAYKERCCDTSRKQANGTSKTRFRPHGVIAVIGPYNFPGHMPNGQIIPALLAGNTVILKPSEYAPATSELIIQCWSEIGLPPGVLSLLQGDSFVGKELCQHNDVNGIFFTGSRNAGESIRAATSVDKICVLEMSGNSPLIVWDSSDIKAAVFATVQSAFITAGQRCSSARRLIVPDNEFGEKFISELLRSTEKICVGSHKDVPEPYMGPLRHPMMVDNLLKNQEDLLSRGAVSLLTSERLSIGKSFVSPGIIDVTSVEMRLDEEIIGPFLQIIRVSDFENALHEANNTKYGLAAGIFTEDEKLYNRFYDSIRAGIINWNQQLTGASPWAPFGGIKNSGNFRPSGFFATDFCVYSTGLIELEKVQLPASLPPGLTIV